MSKKSRNLRVVAAASLTILGCRAVHQGDDSDVKFIGGVAANSGEYASSVYFQHCTAAKIGPRHFLTAAHCLFQNELNRPSFAMVPGTKAQILVGVSLEKGKLVPVTITSSTAYPGFDFATLGKDYGRLDVDNAAPISEPAPATVDIAVVTVEEATPDVPVAQLGEQPISLGSPLAIGGYGCEQEGEEQNPLMRLKYAQVAPIIARGALVSWRAQSETEGYRSTCHGDSGGPVYRDVAGEWKIVGVNSGSPKGYSVFTTLAGPAGAKAAAWVQKKLSEPVTDAPMTFKQMKCHDTPASAPSADGILRTYEFADMKLAVSNGRKISAAIDKFKVNVRPDGSSTLQPYALTVAEAAGCEAGVLCYKVLYTEPSTTEKKMLAVQLKEGKISVYEGEIPTGVIPLGVALDPKSCELSDLTN